MPSPSGPNGRNERGQFAAGNRAAKGNPFAKRVGALRAALLSAITEDDMRAIVLKLVSLAKDGDTIAARVLFDRILGRPVESDLIARIEELEEQLGGES